MLSMPLAGHPITGTDPAVEDSAQASVSPFTYQVPTTSRTGPGDGRVRSDLPVDLVAFTAPCPACGLDREWTQTRDDTRLLTSIGCDCGRAGSHPQS